MGAKFRLLLISREVGRGTIVNEEHSAEDNRKGGRILLLFVCGQGTESSHTELYEIRLPILSREDLGVSALREHSKESNRKRSTPAVLFVSGQGTESRHTKCVGNFDRCCSSATHNHSHRYLAQHRGMTTAEHYCNTICLSGIQSNLPDKKECGNFEGPFSSATHNQRYLSNHRGFK
jgi:hypothetical protein